MANCSINTCWPKCSEVIEAWNFRRGKPGVPYLVAAILSHPMGKYKVNDMGNIAISKGLDRFAQLIVED